jgi:hypothetical protein
MGGGGDVWDAGKAVRIDADACRNGTAGSRAIDHNAAHGRVLLNHFLSGKARLEMVNRPLISVELDQQIALSAC